MQNKADTFLMQEKSLQTLTSLRFFAALYVVSFHTWAHWLPGGLTHQPLFLQNFLMAGQVAVPFFFTLSGFILFFVYENSQMGKRDFWLKRLARIAPVYYASLFFCWLLVRESGQGSIFEYIAIHLSFLSAWAPSALQINFPAWSISVEFFCYMLFPFLLFAIKRMDEKFTLLAMFVVFTLSMVLFILGNAIYPGLLFWPAIPGNIPAKITAFFQLNPLVHITEFIFGMMLAKWRFNIKRNFLKKYLSSDQILLLGVLLLFIPIIVGVGRHFFLAANSFLFLPAFALILYGASYERSSAKFLEHPILILLGESSYSLYILHLPLRDFFDVTLAPLMPVVSKIALFTILSLFVSIFTYKFFESPLRFFSYRRIKALDSI